MADLATRHDVIVPEHPGFGASDTPDWLDNIPDLANFYLDVLDQLDLQNVDLVGFSIGGWIAAELAVRNTAAARVAHAGRRRRHPCQRRRAGRHVPAQRRAAHPRHVPRSQARRRDAAARLAPGARGHPPQEPHHHRQADLAAARLRSASAQMAASDRRADAAHLGRQRPAVSQGLRLRLSAADPRLEGRRSSRIAGICRRSSSGRLSSAHWKASSSIGRPRHEILQLPPDAVPARRPRRDREERLGLGHLFQPRLRSEEGRRALSRISRPDGAGRPARLRRRLPQRASPDRLRHDADARRAGRRAGALGQARQDRDPRPRAAAAQQPAGDRRRIRDARQPDARPLHRRLRARHRRRISRHGHQPGAVAGALRRGARPDHPRLDRARAVRSTSASTTTSTT